MVFFYISDSLLLRTFWHSENKKTSHTTSYHEHTVRDATTKSGNEHTLVTSFLKIIKYLKLNHRVQLHRRHDEHRADNNRKSQLITDVVP